MPFKSAAQRAFMHAKHPKVAAEFEAATPPGAKLPYKVGGAPPKKRSAIGSLADAYRSGSR